MGLCLPKTFFIEGRLDCQALFRMMVLVGTSVGVTECSMGGADDVTI